MCSVCVNTDDMTSLFSHSTHLCLVSHGPAQHVSCVSAAQLWNDACWWNKQQVQMIKNTLNCRQSKLLAFISN